MSSKSQNRNGKQSTNPNLNGQGYMEASRRPLNCLVFVAAILLFYHISSSICVTDQSLMARRDISRLLSYFGASRDREVSRLQGKKCC